MIGHVPPWVVWRRRLRVPHIPSIACASGSFALHQGAFSGIITPQSLQDHDMRLDKERPSHAWDIIQSLVLSLVSQKEIAFGQKRPRACMLAALLNFHQRIPVNSAAVPSADQVCALSHSGQQCLTKQPATAMSKILREGRSGAHLPGGHSP